MALAGYNGGIGVIGRSESTWPAETIRYAYWGSGIYADAAPNASESSRLNEWLAAVPHNKIFAFGADTDDPLTMVGYAAQARQRIAQLKP